MISYRLQLRGEASDALWTPAIAVFDDWEKVLEQVGPQKPFEGSLDYLETQLRYLERTFGQQLCFEL